MTNAQAERALMLDPRLQVELFPAEVRQSDEFKTLMEFVARADCLAVFVPLAAIVVAAQGDVAMRSLLLTALAVRHHPAFLELVAEVEAAAKENAA
jgi:hypothetical protein